MGVRDLTFFGHAKFEVKNFSLYLALWTLFCRWGGRFRDTTFFGHAKFEVKNFFPLFSALDSISAGGEVGGPGPNFFFGHAKFEVKNFSGGGVIKFFYTHIPHTYTRNTD